MLFNECCYRGIGYKNFTSRMLKHLYDKRPAEECDVLIDIIHIIVKFPDIILENKSGKRGDRVFLKIYKAQKYLCVLERNRL